MYMFAILLRHQQKMSDDFFLCICCSIWLVPRVVVWFIYLNYISFLTAPRKATNEKICHNKNMSLLFFGSTGQIPFTANYEHSEKWFYCLFSTWPDFSISANYIFRTLRFMRFLLARARPVGLGWSQHAVWKTSDHRTQRNGDEDLFIFMLFYHWSVKVIRQDLVPSPSSLHSFYYLQFLASVFGVCVQLGVGV